MSGQLKPVYIQNSRSRHFDQGSGLGTETQVDPWKNDVYTPTETSGFQLHTGTASSIRRRYSYVPVGLRRQQRLQTLLPFNWLQLVNIFLGTLALLLFAKLIVVVLSA